MFLTDRKDFPKGMTVKELKLMIQEWPEADVDGEPTEVWITTGKELSSQVIRACALNYRERGGHTWADLIFESAVFDDS